MVKGCLRQGDVHHRFFLILPLFNPFASFSHPEADEEHPPSPRRCPLCCGGRPQRSRVEEKNHQRGKTWC